MLVSRRLAGAALLAVVIGSAGTLAVAPAPAAAATTYTKTVVADFWSGDPGCYCFNGSQVRLATITATASWQGGVNGGAWGNSISTWWLNGSKVSQGFWNNSNTQVTFWLNDETWYFIPGMDAHLFARVVISQGGSAYCYASWSRGPLNGENYIGCTLR